MHDRAILSGHRGRFQGGSLLGIVAVYLSYVAGLTLVVGVLAVAAVSASSALAGRLRQALPLVNRLGGALLVLVGLYVGYYGVYEVRVVADTRVNSPDVVISAAERIQATLAGWVHQHGGWPWGRRWVCWCSGRLPAAGAGGSSAHRRA